MSDPTIATVCCHVIDTGGGRTWLFIQLTGVDGSTGWGEASQNRNDPAVVHEVERLASLYVGHHPLDLIERRQALARWAYEGKSLCAAVSALEQACWDLAGRALGEPVYRLLGGAAHEAVRAYANISLAAADASPEAQGEAARLAVAQGFDAVKLNFGFRPRGPAGSHAIGAWMDGCIERVRAVREAVGNHVDVLVDLVHQLADLKEALAVARALEPFKLFWLEDPFPRDEPEMLAEFRRSVGPRVAGGAQLLHREEFRALLEARALDVIMPDVKWCGGILEMRKLAAQAELYGVTVAPHNFSGPVAAAASVHAAITMPNLLALEFCLGRPAWRGALAQGTEHIEAGAFVRPATPGLGIDLDQGLLAEHALVGPATDIRGVAL
jgi:galactonate dehydratase